MKRSSTFALSALCFGAGAAAMSIVSTACGWKDEAIEGQPVDGGLVATDDAGYAGQAGQACVAGAGQIPNPECDNGDETQCSGTTKCPLSSCQAVNTTAAGCEALTNNPAGGPWNFRMRRIILAAPASLASPTAQNTVVNTGVDMNEPQCGSTPTETGDFSWLLSLDTTAMTLKTGGAPPCDIGNPTTSTPNFPSCNPFTTGYCFTNKTVAGPIHIAPVSAPITKAADGTYSASSIGAINIPIYFNGAIITLPINGGKMTGVKVSADGNCIGSFNPQAFNADCSDDYTACSLWKTDGSITGYITLEQADNVDVTLLNATLCAFLTGTPPAGQGQLAKCPRDANGNIDQAKLAKSYTPGDYCSTTTPPSPGGCQDSFWLAATFAASAVKINDGTGVPDCQGGSGDDDSGTPASNDAGDAAAD